VNRYEIEVRKIRYAFYEIEANSEEEAIELFDGGVSNYYNREDIDHDDIINCRLIEDES
jgi:hypothetical protein